LDLVWLLSSSLILEHGSPHLPHPSTITVKNLRRSRLYFHVVLMVCLTCTDVIGQRNPTVICSPHHSYLTKECEPAIYHSEDANTINFKDKLQRKECYTKRGKCLGTELRSYRYMIKMM
jgi:hypothetical protein